MEQTEKNQQNIKLSTLMKRINTLEKMYSGIISDRGIGGFGSSGIK